MESYQVNILNPKALKLLRDLADLNLISIKHTKDDEFLRVVRQLRSKAAAHPPSIEEITKEVETVRAKRYGQK